MASRSAGACLRSVALAAMVAATLALAVAYASAFAPGGAPGWAAWVFAVALPIVLVAVTALGAARPAGGLGRLVVPIALVWALLSAGFIVVLMLPAESAAAPSLLLGLPLRAAIIVYGVGLLPLLILPLGYALTFESQTLTEEDIQRVRAAAASAGAARRVAAAGATGAAGAAAEE